MVKALLQWMLVVFLVVLGACAWGGIAFGVVWFLTAYVHMAAGVLAGLAFFVVTICSGPILDMASKGQGPFS